MRFNECSPLFTCFHGYDPLHMHLNRYDTYFLELFMCPWDIICSYEYEDLFTFLHGYVLKFVSMGITC